MPNREDPHAWAGQLLARAGYLEDAEHAFAASPERTIAPPYPLWRAWVIYGQSERAAKTLATIMDPEKKAAFAISFADLLWRVGKPDQARRQFEVARELAGKVANTAHRSQMLSSIDQSLQFVSDAPPEIISAIPRPRSPFTLSHSTIPLFPITADGFKDVDSKEVTDRTNTNNQFMQHLYDRMAARDREGLRHIAESASTPFQRALGFASIEHILIQANNPELAEGFAKMIPEADASSTLAKAEALSAVGAAWLRSLDDAHARADFDAAVRLVQSVTDLPLAKVSVLTSIATAQYENGLKSEGRAALRFAVKAAQELPQRPKPQSGIRRTIPLGVHYKDEAFDKILASSIQMNDVTMVQELVDVWRQTGDDVESAVIKAWLDANQAGEALAVARGIKEPASRAIALLVIARDLLDRAGAPNL